MPVGRWFSLLLLIAMCRSAAPLRAQDRKPPEEPAPAHAAKWPLRLHVLAIDDTHRTVRMQPNWSSASVPDVSDGAITPAQGGGATLGGGDDDFSGAGRADLVTPPDSTVGINFTYEGCSRVRVAAGFQGLEARWKKPGSKLEVMIPTEEIADGKVPMRRCTLDLVTQELIYLRLPNGKIVRVTQEDYRKKPALRRFLSGPSETLKRRTAVLPKVPVSP